MSPTRFSEESFLIGELAELAGTSRDMLRHYERKGVLPRPVRSAKGYRLYSAEHIESVKMIRRALAVGFTLDEIARVFAERNSGKAPCREVYALAAAKLTAVKKRLSELETMREELESLVTDWNQRIAQAPVDEAVHLLEDLTIGSEKKINNRKSTSGAENLRRKG
jgi:DNA-binding transcriptional MerR regulator